MQERWWCSSSWQFTPFPTILTQEKQPLSWMAWLLRVTYRAPPYLTPLPILPSLLLSTYIYSHLPLNPRFLFRLPFESNQAPDSRVPQFSSPSNQPIFNKPHFTTNSTCLDCHCHRPNAATVGSPPLRQQSPRAPVTWLPWWNMYRVIFSHGY